MYTREDMRLANMLVRRYGLILFIPLAFLLAGYVCAILAGSQTAMLCILLVAFWYSALEIALWLCPAVQYRAFLREMDKGLRRECLCCVEKINQNIQTRDGVRVFSLQVRLQDGDTRIFYLNASKAEGFASDQKQIRLTAFGRHIVDWREEQ